MQTTTNQTALILFASEQVWPNLLSVAWYHAQGDLRRVFIYYTDDMQRSAQPARRMAKLCEQFTKLQCELPKHGLPMDPESVVAQLRAWQQQYPDVTRWVVNATGGNKLMFSGAINSLPALPGADSGACAAPCWELIYRELAGWYALQRDAQGQLRAQQQPATFIPQLMLNTMPLLSLISTQYQGGDDVTWTQQESTAFTAITEEAMVGLLAEGEWLNWNWQQLFQQQLGVELKSGFAFERFLAAAIHLLGVPARQIGLNVTATHSDTGKVQQEIDVIVNTDGRLIVFDCKLLDESREQKDSFITNLKAAHDTARSLGGLFAQSVLVRPNRVPGDEDKLVAGALRVTLLGLRECKQLFTKLGKILGKQVPAEMLTWERAYLDTDSASPCLSPVPAEVLVYEAVQDEVNSQIFNFAKLRQRCTAAQGNESEPWFACAIRDGQWVLCDRRSDRTSRLQVRHLLDTAVAPMGEVIGLRVSQAGPSWCALIYIHQGRDREFRAWLTAHVGQRLLQ